MMSKRQSSTVLDSTMTESHDTNRQEESRKSSLPKAESEEDDCTTNTSVIFGPVVASKPEESSTTSNGKETARAKRSATDEIQKDEVIQHSKKSRAETSSTANGSVGDDEGVDTAALFGYNDGDRIEVEWDIEGASEDGDQVETRWWGAALLPFDGRTKDKVAIRTLEYDAYPEGGFYEKSREDVVFLDHNVLAGPENMDQLLYYRRAGSEETYGIEAVEPVVDQILERVLAKNQEAWNHLTPAQRAQIASKIASKKEKLVGLLSQQTGVVTSEEMHVILAQTMNE